MQAVFILQHVKPCFAGVVWGGWFVGGSGLSAIIQSVQIADLNCLNDDPTKSSFIRPTFHIVYKAFVTGIIFSTL
jgi:hypothetical protein